MTVIWEGFDEEESVGYRIVGRGDSCEIESRLADDLAWETAEEDSWTEADVCKRALIETAKANAEVRRVAGWAELLVREVAPEVAAELRKALGVKS